MATPELTKTDLSFIHALLAPIRAAAAADPGRNLSGPCQLVSLVAAPYLSHRRLLGSKWRPVEGEVKIAENLMVGHYWLRAGVPNPGLILDLTADQFGWPVPHLCHETNRIYRDPKDHGDDQLSQTVTGWYPEIDASLRAAGFDVPAHAIGPVRYGPPSFAHLGTSY